MLKNAVIILSVLVLTMAAASKANAASKAVEARYSSSLKKCIENSGYADFEMVECYDAELSVQDGRLNQA